jgi:hypothetical protein
MPDERNSGLDWLSPNVRRREEPHAESIV